MAKIDSYLRAMKKFNRDRENIKQSLEEIEEFRPKPIVFMNEFNLWLAHVDDNGNLVVPYRSSSGGPQSATFDKKEALRLAAWIQENFK